MKSVAFIGTFDPMHGGHIGQLLRAHKFLPYDKVYIVVNKRPPHKPNATDYKDRVQMAQMTLDSLELPFDYEVVAVDNHLNPEFDKKIDYKITGIDSLIENLEDESRWPLAQRWPMIVISIKGVSAEKLTAAINALPKHVQPSIRYDYVSESFAPMLNYDFSQQAFVAKRIHSTSLRSGEDQSLIAPRVRRYIQERQLYR